MERLCRECGAPLAGRSDKQFCSDDCRTAYHNRRYRREKRPAEEIERVLRRNRSILAAMYTQGIRSAGLTDIRLKGFNCLYFTAIEHKGPFRKAKYHCYEYSFSIRLGRVCSIAKDEL